MFVDACAIVAALSDEPEAQRVLNALERARDSFTSPVAVLEAVLALSRADKFDLPTGRIEPLVLEFLDIQRVTIRDMPPAPELTKLSLSAVNRYRSGRHGLNLGDCLHYACAMHYRVPILATADEFRQTDLETVA
jgi:ribonuclease VapC